MPEATFGQRLASAFAEHGQLCLGIDPHAHLLEAWGLPDTPSGLRDFGLRIVEAANGIVGLVKPQVAFFERHGAEGFAALEAVLAAARAAGLLTIADAKRGDIGSTVEAYGQAWLTPGGPLEADAMTILAYQGVGSVAAPVALAHAVGKGLLVLAATSNPESIEPQTALITTGPRAGRTVAAGIVDEVIELNAGAQRDSAPIGSIGVVLGATVEAERYGIALEAMAAAPATPILAPGFGHQGAGFAQLRGRYREASPFVIAATSRGVLAAGPQKIAEALKRAAGELAECLA